MTPLANTYYSGAGLMDLGLQEGGVSVQQSFELRAEYVDVVIRKPCHRRHPITLKEILEENPAPHIPDYVAKRLEGKYRDRPIISDPERGDIAPTCVAHYAKDVSTRLVADKNFPYGARPYTVREYARLQGVPDAFKFAGSDLDAYRMIGNGVSVPVGRWIGREIVRYFN